MKFCISRQIGLYLLPLLIPTTNADDDGESSHSDPNKWYQRYADYPGYCSTPNQMIERKIPKLPQNISGVGETKLVHVTSVIHHGARTNLGAEINGPCWDGFWESEETGVWDCYLNTYLAPPSKHRIEEEEEGVNANSKPDSIFLFNLEFDALKKPLSNILNGTCQAGQLLLQGYEQLILNGRFLRETYLYDDSSSDSERTEHDERMQLFSLKQSKVDPDPWDGHFVYVRSGDSQPTLMSGQLLMRGLFNNELEQSRSREKYGLSAFPSIKVHTADHSKDILGGFQNHCPRLDAIKRESQTTKEYQAFYNSIESQQVRAFMEEQLSHDHGLFDCLMTTICTDRPLPDDIGDYDEYKSTWFNRIESYHTQNHSFPLRYNDAEYSKLSIGPLWAEIFDNIGPTVSKDDTEQTHPTVKLAIYSGYDSTIMQLLSSLGENVWDGLVWPPYASMFLIEVHELVDDLNQDTTAFKNDFAFRLIYNGKVLTPLVNGCPKDNELCDIKHLVDRIQPIAVRNVDCVDPKEDEVNAIQVAKMIVSKTEGILLVLIVFGVAVFIGGMAVFWKLTGEVPERVKNKIPEKLKKKAKKMRMRGKRTSVAKEIETEDSDPMGDESDPVIFGLN